MYPDFGTLFWRVGLACFMIHLFCLLSGNDLFAKTRELEPLRLSLQGPPATGPDCEQHPAASPPPARKDTNKRGRPTATLESEHRPVGKRTYYFNEHRRRAVIESYVRRPGGKVIAPELRLGYKPSISFSTPFGDGPVHGANSVYVVEQGVNDEVLTIRTAKWITMHHNCGWGHNGKFDKALTTPQPLATIPFEIVVDKLWDTNFHLSVTSGDRLGITVLSYGQPVPGATVSLSSEKGWSKSAVTDKEGRVTIQMIRDYYPPLWSQFRRTHRGEFLLTALYNADQQGSFRGDSYHHVSYITTLPWQYSPSSKDYASYAYGLVLGLLGMTVSGFGVYIYRERRRRPYKGISFDE